MGICAEEKTRRESVNLTPELIRELAGDCIGCKFYDFDGAHFTDKCYECSRYHADVFEKREPNDLPTV